MASPYVTSCSTGKCEFSNCRVMICPRGLGFVYCFLNVIPNFLDGWKGFFLFDFNVKPLYIKVKIFRNNK